MLGVGVGVALEPELFRASKTSATDSSVSPAASTSSIWKPPDRSVPSKVKEYSSSP